MTTAERVDENLAHLLGRVGIVEDRIRTLVAERRADDPAPDDPFRGLYVTDEAVDRLLAPMPAAPPPADGPRRAAVEERADRAAAAGRAGDADGAGGQVRLRALADRFELTPLDVELLLIALIPDLDSRFERLYGYLNDDVTRRRATVGLALDPGRPSLDVVGRPRAAQRRSPAHRPRAGAGRGGRPAVPDPRPAGPRPGHRPPARGRPSRPGPGRSAARRRSRRGRRTTGPGVPQRPAPDLSPRVCARHRGGDGRIGDRRTRATVPGRRPGPVGPVR